MTESPNYLSPDVLAKISGLEYKARLIVEGFLSGPHRSPYSGFSVEFAQHREYVPGDDLRHLDWKIWGRSDRLYIKQYDAETNFDLLLILDSSGSMGFGSGAMSKIEYCKHAAAALAYLVLQQRDAVGLRIFGGSDVNLTPSSSPARRKELIHHLEVAVASGDSSLASVLFQIAERGGRRKVVVVLSDFLEVDEQDLLRSLRLLSGRKHDVLLFHVFDPAEASFPFADFTSFAGLEGEGILRIEPRRLRAAYIDELNRHAAMIRNAARESRMDYLPVVTDKSLGEILSAYLVSRSAKK